MAHISRSALTRPTFICLLFLMIAAAFSCSSEDPTVTPTNSVPTPFVDLHPGIGEPFELPVNGSAFLDEHGYRVTFMRVVQDNRCPDGVNCPVAGAAVIELQVRQSSTDAGRRHTFGIGDDSAEPPSQTVGNFEIELMDLSPTPAGPGTAPTATLVARRAQSTPGQLDINARVEPSSAAASGAIEVITDAGGSGIPQYTLWIANSPVSTLRYDGTLIGETAIEGMEITEWSADSSGASWSIKAGIAGDIPVKVSVNGEVRASLEGPFMFAYGEKTFTITVDAAS